MKPHLAFRVSPQVPQRLDGLVELANNLWWSWAPAARRLYYQIDPALWERSRFSPLKVLQGASQQRLESLAQDDDFCREFDAVMTTFRAYLEREDTWAKVRQGTEEVASGTVAYFSAEFGFHESMPIYSGGLGILSGDHCKSASDLGLDFVAVGLLYRHGYFRQEIDSTGWQQAVEMDLDFHQLPISRATDASGQEIAIEVELPGRKVTVQVWQLNIGRIRLLLLDTDTPLNSEADRKITYQLYGGDKVMRISQEIVLGMGGVRALDALGIKPAVCHMNEGHSTFLSLERIRRVMAATKLPFHAALQQVAASNVFTTHTPVPAGNDAFTPELITEYFSNYAAEVGISIEELLHFGRIGDDPAEEFSMTVLALRTSRHANGVSALHGEVSRGMWQDVWFGVPLDEVPITSITNGIHTKTWLATEVGALYDRYLGQDWEEYLITPEWWSKVIDIPASELWAVHQLLKKRLIEFARARIADQRRRNKENPSAIREAGTLLDPEILTIGFARRFATYKRATLLFDDPERLQKILNHPERPVQFLFAGKSHPADDGGKAFIQKVIEFSRKAGFSSRVAFIEDYDHRIGRRLYQGVDLWLNNPLRPLEASGTSGMKLPPNGGINLSVLDGWWCEAFNRRNGWAIGEEITEGTLDFQNEVDAESLYNLLENQIIPLYYAKPDGIIPSAWIEIMRESMRTIVPVFNTNRMVAEYSTRLYAPAATAGARLAGDKKDSAPAASLSQWKNQLRQTWESIRVVEAGIDSPTGVDFTSGTPVPVRALVDLGGVDPDSVRVEAYYGTLNEHDDIQRPRRLTLHPVTETASAASAKSGETKAATAGPIEYRGSLEDLGSGAYGLLVRITPQSPLLTQPHETRLIRWSQN